MAYIIQETFQGPFLDSNNWYFDEIAVKSMIGSLIGKKLSTVYSVAGQPKVDKLLPPPI